MSKQEELLNYSIGRMQTIANKLLQLCEKNLVLNIKLNGKI
jgi:hypothetical protein